LLLLFVSQNKRGASAVPHNSQHLLSITSTK